MNFKHCEMITKVYVCTSVESIYEARGGGYIHYNGAVCVSQVAHLVSRSLMNTTVVVQ